jgi:hypothetical protein
MKKFVEMLAYTIGWLFLLSTSQLSFAQETTTLKYSIYFQENEDALPAMADLDSIKALAAIALESDTQRIVIRRYMDYWQKGDQYYTLVRKRSFLLKQIFEREGLGPERLQLISQTIEDPDSAKQVRHRIDLLLQKRDSVTADTIVEEINYYAEIRDFLTKVISKQEQHFRINPWRDTLVYTKAGAMLYIPKNSFAVDPRADWIDLYWQEVYKRSELIPLILLSPEYENKLQEWAAVWNIQANYKGKVIQLRNGAEIMSFQPTDDLITDLRWLHSVQDPSQSFQWRKKEMGSWQPIHPLCLHLAEADSDSFSYFCNRPLLAKPKAGKAPEKPQKPSVEEPNATVLASVDSLLAINEMVVEEIRAAFEKKEDRWWVGKKRKQKNERQYQRELESALKQKRAILKLKQKELDRVQTINDSIMATYKTDFNRFNRIRDSLQQSYLTALRNWHITRDSLEWLCSYEQHAVGFLRQNYGDSLLLVWQNALKQSIDPNLAGPASEPLFPTGHQHLILPIKKMGWSSLQRPLPYTENSLEYKAFTFGPELPSYKIAAATIMRSSRAAALSTALNLDNMAFNPLPEEAPIHLIAVYVDGEKAYLNLHQAIANKLPYKLEFIEYQSFEAFRVALKALDE